MPKSRTFSIYLLKEGFNAQSALKDDNNLQEGLVATRLPPGAILYVLNGRPRPPWWKDFFGIEENLLQSTKGALVIFPVKDRWFALSFGHVYHNLKDACYEYDFGLRVTLNSLDPRKLKSTDVLEPGDSKRRRTQIPIESDLTLFDFDRDSTILKSLTGKVKDEHKDLFRHATGASNLKLSSSLQPNELVGLCENLLGLYQSDDYKIEFPEIQNIVPVRDPTILKALDDKLVEAIKARDDKLNLVVPDMINYHDNLYAKFSGRGRCDNYEEVFIGLYLDYLANTEGGLEEIEVLDLKKHQLLLTDEEGDIRERYPIYKSLLFDVQLSATETFHLSEGCWYKVENAYVQKMEAYLDPLCVDLNFPNFNHVNEAAYNLALAQTADTFICLDTKNIAPAGHTAVEPCDVYGCDNNTGVFHHVKISTLSSALSHLFNQGANSIELLKAEDEALEKLRVLIRDGAIADKQDAMLEPLNERKFKMVYVIITHKDKANKSKNLPLFSKISLMRIMKILRIMSVEGVFGFVHDAKN
jgi:uncharacterized protein (TIGR04141 family)